MAVAPPLTALELPLLDLASYLAGQAGALAQTAAQLRGAFETLGFVILLNHGVSAALVEATFTAARRFHAQPAAAKQALSPEPAGDGYLELSHVEGHRTALWSCTRSTPQTRQAWPPKLPGFRETIEAYLLAMERLHDRLIPLLALARGLPVGELQAALAAPILMFRMNHYPPAPPGAPLSALPAHGDGPLWTMLPASTVPGLEVQDQAGAWHLLPVVPGSILVNAGQLMQYWSQGQFPALLHRVIAPIGQDRYALPCFIGPALKALAYLTRGL